MFNCDFSNPNDSPPTYHTAMRDPSGKVDPSAVAYFQSIPWCAALMSSPSLTLFPTTSRHMKPSTESALLGSILNRKDTIRAYLAFHHPPTPGDGPSISSLTTLLALEHGVNGLPNIVHGGLICVLMDDAMGQLLMANQIVDEEGTWHDMATGELKTRYLKVVRTPQVVVIKAEIKEVRGKKCLMETELVDEGGEVLARSEAVWIAVGGAVRAKV